METYLKGKTREAQLAEIRRQIVDTMAERDRIDAEIDRRVMAVMHGDTDANAATAELKRQRREVEERLDTLHRAETDRQGVVNRQAEERRRAEAVALPTTLAELVAQGLALDDRIQETARAHAEMMREKLAIDEKIARLCGNETFDRARTRTPALIRDAVAACYRIDPSRPDQPGATYNNNLLGIESGLLGPQRGMTLRDLDEPRFDDLVPYFLTEDAANAAAARLKARNTPATAGRTGKVWALFRHDEMFKTAADAHRAVQTAARRGISLVVVAHGPGFRTCPASFADSEILLDTAPQAA